MTEAGLPTPNCGPCGGLSSLNALLSTAPELTSQAAFDAGGGLRASVLRLSVFCRSKFIVWPLGAAFASALLLIRPTSNRSLPDLPDAAISDPSPLQDGG
jgi:hypothetical protein